MSTCGYCQKECKNKFCTKSCGMKYRRAHKDEYAEYFEKLRDGTKSRRKESKGCLECGNSTPRHYNKFCSRECYRIWKSAHPEEYAEANKSSAEKLRKFQYVSCPHCQEELTL